MLFYLVMGCMYRIPVPLCSDLLTQVLLYEEQFGTVHPPHCQLNFMQASQAQVPCLKQAV